MAEAVVYILDVWYCTALCMIRCARGRHARRGLGLEYTVPLGWIEEEASVSSLDMPWHPVTCSIVCPKSGNCAEPSGAFWPICLASCPVSTAENARMRSFAAFLGPLQPPVMSIDTVDATLPPFFGLLDFALVASRFPPSGPVNATPATASSSTATPCIRSFRFLLPPTTAFVSFPSTSCSAHFFSTASSAGFSSE